MCSQRSENRLTGRTILLPTDDVAAYQQHIARFQTRWSPSGDEESELVQSLADTEWRLLRIPGFEAGILAVGRYELAGLFSEVQDSTVRAALIEGRVLLTYRRDLNNLALQETRLSRRSDKDTVTLKGLQTVRKAAYEVRMDHAVRYYCDAIKENWELHLEHFGSEFSLEDLMNRDALRRAKKDRYQYPEVTRHMHLKDIKDEYEKYLSEDDEDEEQEKEAA